MLAAADAGQSVVASILALGAAGVAVAIVAMAWSVHTHQIQLAERLAGRPADEPADDSRLAHPASGNGNSTGNGNGNRNGNSTGSGTGNSTGSGNRNGNGHGSRPAPPSAIQGPDRLVIGEQARYRVRRSSTQQVVAWAAGGGAVSQASDPAHPDDLLLVADQPGTLTVSVRLREGLAERRETKAVTAVDNPREAVAASSRLFLQDWPLTVAVVVIAGFAAALAALGSLGVGDFIALAVPLAALLAVVAATRGPAGPASGGRRLPGPSGLSGLPGEDRQPAERRDL